MIIASAFSSIVVYATDLMPDKVSHRKAVNTAAYVCTQAGAWPQYPAEMPDYLAEIGKPF